MYSNSSDITDVGRARIAVLVPTFNEPGVLRECVRSLRGQSEVDLEVIVVNAGDRLPADIAAEVTEIAVPSDYYWTACIEQGMRLVVDRGGYSHVMLLNADNVVLPGSVQLLAKEVSEGSRVVACCAAYTGHGGQDARILYSHQDQLGDLLLFKLGKAWTTPCDAPTTPFKTDNAGGQGTLFSVGLLAEVWPDAARFPHYMGDTDLWLQVRRSGGWLTVVPQAGTVNIRPFRGSLGTTRTEKVRRAWWKFTSPNSLDSFVILWRLRRKHLPIVRATTSFALVVPFRLSQALYHLLSPEVVHRLDASNEATAVRGVPH